MDIRERLIIRADGRPKQPFPETAALGPPRLQVSALLRGYAIDLGNSHLNDGRRDRGGHAENQIERARHRAADCPCVHQDLANQQCGALGLRRVRGFREQRIAPPLACALPPLGALKIQVDEKDRAAPRPLAYARVHLRPQRGEHCIGRGAVRPRARRHARSTGAPYPRRSRLANAAARSSAAEFSASFAWSIRLPEKRERIFHRSRLACVVGFRGICSETLAARI